MLSWRFYSVKRSWWQKIRLGSKESLRWLLLMMKSLMNWLKSGTKPSCHTFPIGELKPYSQSSMMSSAKTRREEVTMLQSTWRSTILCLTFAPANVIRRWSLDVTGKWPACNCTDPDRRFYKRVRCNFRHLDQLIDLNLSRALPLLKCAISFTIILIISSISQIPLCISEYDFWLNKETEGSSIFQIRSTQTPMRSMRG